MYLGIEIGGTKLLLGLGRADGQIKSLWRDSVDRRAGGEGIRRKITSGIPKLLDQAGLSAGDLESVGVGFGGPVDYATGRVFKSHQISGWDNFPLREWLREQTNLPVVVGNDAEVAGLGEVHFGAGKGNSPVFYLTIGSGIGGGLILNGQIYRGIGRGAGEIGHLVIRMPGFADENDVVFQEDILENFASGWAIEKRGKTTMSMDLAKESLLFSMADGEPEAVSAKLIAEAAQQDDFLCQRILEYSWDALAEGICSMITLLCPQRIVIGGGVSLMGEELLFQPLRKKVAERVFQPFADCYEIVPAQLGEEVVLHGAFALTHQQAE